MSTDRDRSSAVKAQPLAVTVDDRGIEVALRVFKRRVQKDGLLKELRQRRHYEKPSKRRRRKQREAARRLRRKLRRQSYSG